MRIIIGFILIVLGGLLASITEFMPFVIIVFIGMFLFASFPQEDVFCDYVIANEEQSLVRKRHYLNFLPLSLIVSVISFRCGKFLIPWKDEYFKVANIYEETPEIIKLSRKEYMTLRKEQRRIYATQSLSPEFMQKSYTVQDIGLNRKKFRLIASSIAAALTLTMFTEPAAIGLTLICLSVFLSMIILWIPDYKDAKILQAAYDRAMATHPAQNV